MSADKPENNRTSVEDAMPPVLLRKRWKSSFKGGGNNDGTIDLSPLRDDGNARDCTHDANAISGGVEEINDPAAPTARYRVQLNERLSGSLVRIQYRGIAIFNPATNEINKIIGTKRIIRPFPEPKDAPGGFQEDNTVDLLSQEEGTWVGTQP